VIAGSCSQATLAQVAAWARGRPAFRVDPLAAAAGEDVAAAALRWAAPLLGREPVLVYATAEPAVVAEAQSRLGRERAGALVEGILARVARGLVEGGVRRLVVAGGETAGAVVGALGVRALRIGPQIEPGVPWTATFGEPTLALALKSGNFGSPGFFARALESAADGARVETPRQAFPSGQPSLR
jgi:3-dehydrotetronate 4-kinase